MNKKMGGVLFPLESQNAEDYFHRDLCDDYLSKKEFQSFIAFINLNIEENQKRLLAVFLRNFNYFFHETGRVLINSLLKKEECFNIYGEDANDCYSWEREEIEREFFNGAKILMLDFLKIRIELIECAINLVKDGYTGLSIDDLRLLLVSAFSRIIEMNFSSEFSPSAWVLGDDGRKKPYDLWYQIRQTSTFIECTF